MALGQYGAVLLGVRRYSYRFSRGLLSLYILKVEIWLRVTIAGRRRTSFPANGPWMPCGTGSVGTGTGLYLVVLGQYNLVLLGI